MQIYILSGKIQSGKTSYLLNYADKNRCSGILSPVIQNKRHFYCIKTKEIRAMEAVNSEAQILEIGKYKFSQSAFNWAIDRIEMELNQKTELLILDEIGPLELKGKGFAELLTKILKTKFKLNRLVLVIREQAVKEVLLHFGINELKVKVWNWTPLPYEQ